MIKNILFDLDGTITDSSLGITKSVKYALEKKGINVASLDELKIFIGPPLSKMFIKYMNLETEEQGREMVALYREYYKDIGIYENTLYDGIKETLKTLKEKGYRLFVATSKPTVFSEEILRKHNILECFEKVSGCELDGTRDSKEEVIKFLLDNYNLNPQETIMVGDRVFDVEGAEKLNIKTIGVLYGFGDEEELKDAVKIAKTPMDIIKLIAG